MIKFCRTNIPRWIKIDHAVTYSALGRDELKRLVKSGRIRGYQHGKRQDFIIDRFSIDQYHLGNIPKSDRDTALEIMGSL